MTQANNVGIGSSQFNSSGVLQVAGGGTGTATPAIVAGTGISVSGSFPNQTITNSSPANGLQSKGQVVISSNTTLGASQAGGNIVIVASGITITFPSTVTTYALDNQSGGTVTLAYPTGTDYKTKMNSGDSVILCGDGGGFWRAYGPSNLSTQAAAWVRFTGGTGSPLTITKAYNVSSVTRTNVGKYVVNFTNVLADTAYNVIASSASTQSQGIFALPFYSAAGTTGSVTTSSFPILYLGTNGAPFDVDYCNIAIFD